MAVIYFKIWLSDFEFCIFYKYFNAVNWGLLSNLTIFWKLQTSFKMLTQLHKRLNITFEIDKLVVKCCTLLLFFGFTLPHFAFTTALSVQFMCIWWRNDCEECVRVCVRVCTHMVCMCVFFGCEALPCCRNVFCLRTLSAHCLRHGCRAWDAQSAQMSLLV